MSLFFKKRTNKNCIPTNNHHSIETFIEAIRNEKIEKNEKNTIIKLFESSNQVVESNPGTAI